MTIQVPLSLAKTKDSALVMEAIYFVVRVLGNSIRGYQHSEVSTEPSPKARRLAAKALKEIEAAEKAPITRIRDNRLEAYISVLDTLLAELALPVSETLLDDAEKMLQEMRAHST
jgi:hypothetical protein